MPSRSLQRWQTIASAALDQVEDAHAAVGGVAPGRRYTTMQVNHSCVMLLSSHFQGFCRNLHTEAVEYLIQGVAPPALRLILRADLTRGRKLDHGNPNPGNLGADFGRLGMRLWPSVHALGVRNQQRNDHLEKMSKWRNAIAHQDFGPNLDPPSVQLRHIRRWRSVCEVLAMHFDRVVAAHIQTVTGARPW